MARIVRFVLSLALVAIFSQEGVFASDAMRQQQQQQMNRVGGYRSVDVDDARVVEVAGFALETLRSSSSKGGASLPSSLQTFAVGPLSVATSPRVRVVAAEQQVVAGLNYKLTLQIVDEDRDECLGVFNVVIYDQFGNMSVTEWGELSSCDELVEGEQDEKDAIEGNE